jgi:hypothetical protein
MGGLLNRRIKEGACGLGSPSFGGGQLCTGEIADVRLYTCSVSHFAYSTKETAILYAREAAQIQKELEYLFPADLSPQPGGAGESVSMTSSISEDTTLDRYHELIDRELTGRISDQEAAELRAIEADLDRHESTDEFEAQMREEWSRRYSETIGVLREINAKLEKFAMVKKR